MNNLKFELLYDLGINAIGDGYYREAVASITAEECLNALGKQIEENDRIWEYLGEGHPELFCTDTLTICLGNVHLKTHLYYLYLRVRLYQLLLNNNPEDSRLKEEYLAADQVLRDYHNGLCVYD